MSVKLAAYFRLHQAINLLKSQGIKNASVKRAEGVSSTKPTSSSVPEDQLTLPPLKSFLQKYYGEPIDTVIGKAKAQAEALAQKKEGPNALNYFAPLNYDKASQRIPLVYRDLLRATPADAGLLGAYFRIHGPQEDEFVILDRDYRQHPPVIEHELTHAMEISPKNPTAETRIQYPALHYPYLLKDPTELTAALAALKRIYNMAHYKPGQSYGFTPEGAQKILDWTEQGKGEYFLEQAARHSLEQLLSEKTKLFPRPYRDLLIQKYNIMRKLYMTSPDTTLENVKRYAQNPYDSRIPPIVKQYLDTLAQDYQAEQLHERFNPFKKYEPLTFEERFTRDWYELLPIWNILDLGKDNPIAIRHLLEQTRKYREGFKFYNQNTGQYEELTPAQVREILLQRLQHLIQNRRGAKSPYV